MFDKNVKFKYDWRPYQKRVLDEVEKHIKDKKIHIVAAPGSGKTVLGLELARYLNNPVLFLAPTITIKNQWIDRFVTSFTDYKEVPDFISSDIYDLKFFNVATYQALHYAYKKRKIKEELDEDTDDVIKENLEQKEQEVIKTYDIVEKLKENKITTIVLDEAHHLKSDWWDSLRKVIEELGNVNVISLTATPPYDSNQSEWKKYLSLCGEIDAEVSVPELVKVNNLCPHQDYIYFNMLDELEKEELKKYEEDLNVELNNIKNNEILKEAILNHKYIKTPYESEEELLDNVEYYSSMLIYLKNAGVKIPKENIKILGGSTDNIPQINIDWIEILIKNILQSDRKSYVEYEEEIEKIESSLKKLGIIEKNEIAFKDNKKLQKYFINSKGKLDSISKIYKIESDSLKENLRMVVLTDYIRKEYIETENTDSIVNKMGVFPIFNKLIKDYGNINMAILTGQIFVIPKSVKENLYGLLVAHEIDDTKVKFEELSINSEYLIVKMPDGLKNKVMNLICKLFSNGLLNVIVGTKSLLGEGWDEPSINTLVLASFVGSFMLSNQMRGRAIRINSKEPKKAANIWHLVCVTDDKTELSNPDLDLLIRRFRSFCGLNYTNNIVTYGINRVGLDNVMPPFSDMKVERINKMMEEKACDRDAMYNAWQDAVANANHKTIIQSSVNMSAEEKPKKVWFVSKNFIIAVVIFILVLILSMFTKIPVIFKIAEAILGIYVIVKSIKIFKNSKSENMLKNVGVVTLNSLIRCGFIKTSRSKIKLNINKNGNNISCNLTGVDTKEANIFTTCIEEIFSKTENQRYIIARLDKNLKEINDYYNVPSILSTNKELAEVFSKYFKQKIGEHDLVYTRTADGRKMLLKARMKNMNLKNIVSKDDENMIYK